MTSTTQHKTVLLHEAVDGLALKPGAIFFDGTLGGAGHSAEVCALFEGSVRVIATDRDSAAIARAEKKFEGLSCKHNFILSDYRHVDSVLAEAGVHYLDAFLLDLGLSSDQLDVSGRGFTFRNDEPLFMTFETDAEERVNANMVVNKWGEETIADILYAYGDERYSRRIAKAIVTAREIHPIKTTSELVEIIRNAVPPPYRHGKTHFATKTFQALRIAVNDEIGALREGMEKGWQLLAKDGRMAIIAFHSLEDREVKNFFRDKARAGAGKLITKKPIVPTKKEVSENPRSRSAKLRIIEKYESKEK